MSVRGLWRSVRAARGWAARCMEETRAASGTWKRVPRAVAGGSYFGYARSQAKLGTQLARRKGKRALPPDISVISITVP